MEVSVRIWRDGQELGELDDYGVRLGPVEWTVGEKCEFRADLLSGRLEPGDWLQVYLDGVPCGRYWYWASSWTWEGRARISLELGSADRVLELAHVYTPGVLGGIQGDSLVDGQPLTAVLREICFGLGLEYSGPTIDRVATGDYAWDIGTSFAEVVDQIVLAMGLTWTVGRRGEILVYAPPLGQPRTIEADEVHELTLRPSIDALANVVVAEREGSSQPADAAIAIDDDPSSLTSTVRLFPRVHYMRGLSVGSDFLRVIAQQELERRRRLGGQGTIQLAVRADIWPGDRLIVRDIASRPLRLDVEAVRFREGASTIELDVTTEVYAWVDAI